MKAIQNIWLLNKNWIYLFKFYENIKISKIQNKIFNKKLNKWKVYGYNLAKIKQRLVVNKILKCVKIHKQKWKILFKLYYIEKSTFIII